FPLGSLFDYKRAILRHEGGNEAFSLRIPVDETDAPDGTIFFIVKERLCEQRTGEVLDVEGFDCGHVRNSSGGSFYRSRYCKPKSFKMIPRLRSRPHRRRGTHELPVRRAR